MYEISLSHPGLLSSFSAAAIEKIKYDRLVLENPIDNGLSADKA